MAFFECLESNKNDYSSADFIANLFFNAARLECISGYPKERNVTMIDENGNKVQKLEISYEDMKFVKFPKSWIPSIKLLLPEWIRAIWRYTKRVFNKE